VVVSASGQEKYLAEIFNGTAGILSDTTEEKGGSGKYFRPHDLLEAALASCLNITTRMVLEAMNLSCEKVTVKVELDRSDEAKTVFKYEIDIAGAIENETREAVLARVMNCPVKKTLSKPLEFVRTTDLG